jgi:hypothetical protein
VSQTVDPESRRPTPSNPTGAAPAQWPGLPSVVQSIIAVLTTRLLLVAVGLATLAATPPSVLTDGREFRHARAPASALVDMWARWDAEWYLAIAARGYRAPLEDSRGRASGVADMRANFFPAFPLAMRALTPLLGHPVVAGVVLSNLCLIAALTILHAWTWTRVSRAAADRLVWLYACFPTSFFLSAVYAESLALASLALAWWLAHRGRWFPSGLAVALAILSRPVGGFGAVALDWWAMAGTPAHHATGEQGTAAGAPSQANVAGPWSAKARRAAAMAVPSLVAFAGYLAFASMTFGDPLATVRSQAEFRGPTTWPWLAFWRYWQEGPAWLGWANSTLDASIAVLALAALPFVLTRLGVAELLLAAGVILLPLASGLISFSRLVLPAFPLFVIAAAVLRGRAARFVIPALMALQALLFSKYVAWQWVA